MVCGGSTATYRNFIWNCCAVVRVSGLDNSIWLNDQACCFGSCRYNLLEASKYLHQIDAKHYSVNVPEAKPDSGFNAGALIGDIERWLILAFVILQRYEAIGLLIAAKSIIRFGEKDTAKTEYVLAGTLMSIFIVVMTGLMVILV